MKRLTPLPAFDEAWKMFAHATHLVTVNANEVDGGCYVFPIALSSRTGLQSEESFICSAIEETLGNGSRLYDLCVLSPS